MITDEMLRAAAGEVSAAMAASIPEQAHTFSPGFEGKMRSLIRRSEHPLRRRVLRQAAAVLIAVLMVFSALYLTVPSVRAAVHSWIRTTVGNDVEYVPQNTLSSIPQCTYHMTEIDGYILLTTVNKEGGMQYIYTAPDGTMMTFLYSHSNNFSLLRLHDVTDYDYHSTFIGNDPADIYIAPTSEETSVIVWISLDDGTIFCISAAGDQDKLLDLAKKVEKNIT